MEIKRLRKQLHKLDRAAVVSLTERYRLPLIGFAYTYVRDEATAEDVVSDAVVRLLVKSPRLRDERALKSYLFSATKNVALDYLRKSKREKKGAELLAIEQTGEDGLFESLFIKNERQRGLLTALAALNADYREVLYLHYFEEMPIEETAKATGRTKKQTYNLLARAKSALAQILEKEEETE